MPVVGPMFFARVARNAQGASYRRRHRLAKSSLVSRAIEHSRYLHVLLQERNQENEEGND